MKISVFTRMCANLPLEKVFPLLKKHHVAGIEIAGNELHLPVEITTSRLDEIKALAIENQVEIVALGTYTGFFSQKSKAECEEQLVAIQKYLEIAKHLNCPMIRVFCGGPNAFLANEEHYNHSAGYMKKACDIAAAYGVKILVEIHNNSLVESAEQALKMGDLVGRDNLGFIHDAGNMFISGCDFGAESVEILGKRLLHVHVKGESRAPAELSENQTSDELSGRQNCFYDKTIRGEELFCHTLLKDSAADHRPLFEALEKTGYQGWYSLECGMEMEFEKMLVEEVAEVERINKSLGIL